MENSNIKRGMDLEASEEFRLLMAYTSRRSVRGALSRESTLLKKTNMKKKMDVVGKVSKIVESLHIAPSDIESDSNDDVIQTIVDLLRESGDRLNEEIKRNKTLYEMVQSFNYNLFEMVTNLFVESLEPLYTSDTDELNRTKVALTFEVTKRLMALQCHPMNRLMGFGAKYLQHNFSTWAQQQGGWERAFDTDDDDEEVQ